MITVYNKSVVKLDNTFQGILMDVQSLQTVEQLQASFDTLVLLRPHLKQQENWVEQIQFQHQQGYQSKGIYDNDKVVAYMGFRFLMTLAWGSIMYIDDLVTHQSVRGKGYAAALLKYADDLARKSQCDQIHLDSGYTRLDAHRLYLNHDFHLTSHHFSKVLVKSS